MNKWLAFCRQNHPLIILAVALTATMGSLYYSEIIGFIPCRLCWFQRILMYPIVLIALTSIWRNDDAAAHYALPLALPGAGIALYHYLIQMGLFSQPGSCSIGVPCSVRYLNYLGFISIPFMALTAFMLIITVASWTLWQMKREVSTT